MTRTARRLLLVGGVIIVALLAVTTARRGADQAVAPGPAATTARTLGGVPAPDSPVADLRLERLRRENEELAETARDPFRFRPKATPPPPSARKPVAPPPLPPPVAIAPPVPAGPPPPPPIPLKFIGLLDAPGRGQMAILSDSRGDVFYGKEGDIIEGRYKVLRVSPDAAELSYTDGRGRQTIRLGQ